MPMISRLVKKETRGSSFDSRYYLASPKRRQEVAKNEVVPLFLLVFSGMGDRKEKEKKKKRKFVPTIPHLAKKETKRSSFDSRGPCILNKRAK